MDKPLGADIVLSTAIIVGISIAGFTGIVVSITRPGKISAREKISVSILLLSSIATVTLGFLPMIFLNAGVNERLTWTISSTLWLIYFVGIVTYRVWEFRDSSAAMPGWVAAGLVFLGVVALLQVANAIVIRASWPYLILVVGYVIYAFLVFAYLLWNLWTE